LRLWNVTTGRCNRTFEQAHVGFVLCCSISGDSKWLLSGGVDGVLKLWDSMAKYDAGQGAPECEQAMTRHSAAVTCCAISSDGSFFLSGSDDRYEQCKWEHECEDLVHGTRSVKDPTRSCF
jgi:WD40 repeat protein